MIVCNCMISATSKAIALPCFVLASMKRISFKEFEAESFSVTCMTTRSSMLYDSYNSHIANLRGTLTHSALRFLWMLVTINDSYTYSQSLLYENNLFFFH